QTNGGERAGEAGRGTSLVERQAVAVPKPLTGGGIEQAGEQAASQAAHAEARGLFGRENEEFDRVARAETGAREGADGFETAKHAYGAIVAASVGNGVDVRAGGDRRQVRSLACPAREGVANGVLT